MRKWFRGQRKWYKLVIDKKTNTLSREFVKFRVTPIFKWFDFYVGVYVDNQNRLIYIFPLPMFGFRIGYQYKD